jgi:hypothetical protein
MISRSEMGSGSEFTELQAKRYADMLPDFASHRRQNQARSRKHSCKKQCLFTARCHEANRCNRLPEVWPWPLFSSSFTEAGTKVAVRELSGTTSYACPECNLCSTLHGDWIKCTSELGAGICRSKLNLFEGMKFIESNEINTIFFKWSKFNLECVGESVTHYFACLFVIVVSSTRISQNTGTQSNKYIETNHFFSLRTLVHLSVFIILVIFLYFYIVSEGWFWKIRQYEF